MFFQATHTLPSKTAEHLLSTLRGQGLVFVKYVIMCVDCIELSLTSGIISHVVSCKCFLGAWMNHQILRFVIGNFLVTHLSQQHDYPYFFAFCLTFLYQKTSGGWWLSTADSLNGKTGLTSRVYL